MAVNYLFIEAVSSSVNIELHNIGNNSGHSGHTIPSLQYSTNGTSWTTW